MKITLINSNNKMMSINIINLSKMITILLLFCSSNILTTDSAPVAELNSLKLKGPHEPHNMNIKQPEINLNEDDDVLELESLKQNADEAASELLPELKRKLEAIEASTSIVLDEINMEEQLQRELLKTKEQHEEPHYSEQAHHHHPMAVDHGKMISHEESKNHEKPVKTFPGAARLTFGQHETDAQQAVTSTNTETALIASQPEEIQKTVRIDEAGSSAAAASAATATSNGQRRSYSTANTKVAKTNNGETLLKHKGGQYSAFDMAQYVFWTGDESGVARAVEEFIQEGLMSRENAITFLKDIRIGIEYLQNTYANHFNGEGHGFNENDRSDMELEITTAEPTSPPTTTIRATTTKAPPMPELQNLLSLREPKATLSPNIMKIMYKLKIPSLMNINEAIQNDENVRKSTEENQIDFDEVAGRLRLADFLYAEYSLEEVIYQLAKVMFSQSLVRGSEEAQVALQRLTGFLESEGTHGRISPALQKKILDVLLTALSDTLSENPELMSAAHNLSAANIIPKTVKTKI